MKKIYQKPETETVIMEQDEHILRGSTYENYARRQDFDIVLDDEMEEEEMAEQHFAADLSSMRIRSAWERDLQE